MVGAGNTLADVLAIFKRVAAINDGFKYLEVLRKHIKLVAHTTVRNVRIIFKTANVNVSRCNIFIMDNMILVSNDSWKFDAQEQISRFQIRYFSSTRNRWRSSNSS